MVNLPLNSNPQPTPYCLNPERPRAPVSNASSTSNPTNMSQTQTPANIPKPPGSRDNSRAEDPVFKTRDQDSAAKDGVQDLENNSRHHDSADKIRGQESANNKGQKLISLKRNSCSVSYPRVTRCRPPYMSDTGKWRLPPKVPLGK